MIRPRCVVPECNEPRFYDTEGSPCLDHINNPPPKRQSRRPEPPSVVEESESSD